jgi:hypothetical protein
LVSLNCRILMLDTLSQGNWTMNSGVHKVDMRALTIA